MIAYTIYDAENRLYIRNRAIGQHMRSECLAQPYFDTIFAESGKRRMVKLYSAWETSSAERAQEKAARLNSENPEFNFRSYEISCSVLGACAEKR